MTINLLPSVLVVTCLLMSSDGQYHEANSIQINSYNIMTSVLQSGSVSPECKHFVQLNVLNYDDGVCSRLDIYKGFLLLVGCNESEVDFLNNTACNTSSTQSETTTTNYFPWNDFPTTSGYPSRTTNNSLPHHTTRGVSPSSPTSPRRPTTNSIVTTGDSVHKQIFVFITDNVKSPGCVSLVTSLYNTEDDLSRACQLLTSFKDFLEMKCSNSETGFIYKNLCNMSQATAPGTTPSDKPTASSTATTVFITGTTRVLTYSEVLRVVVSGLTSRCHATVSVEFETLMSTDGCKSLVSLSDQILDSLICTQSDYEKLYQVVCRKNVNIEQINIEVSRMEAAAEIMSTRLSVGCRDVIARETDRRFDLKDICTKFKLAGQSLVRLGTCSKSEYETLRIEVRHDDEGENVTGNAVGRLDFMVFNLVLIVLFVLRPCSHIGCGCD